MAVYEGARPRTIALPRRPGLREVGLPVLPRRRARAAVRARRTTAGRPGFVLGAIVVAFMLAFFSLAQEVRVSATSYDIGRLQVERERLDDANRRGDGRGHDERDEDACEAARHGCSLAQHPRWRSLWP